MRLALPLVLVAAMLAIATGLELALFRHPFWLEKLPLALLLTLAFLRSSGRRPAR